MCVFWRRKWVQEKKMRGENKYFSEKIWEFGGIKVFLQFFEV